MVIAIDRRAWARPFALPNAQTQTHAPRTALLWCHALSLQRALQGQGRRQHDTQARAAEHSKFW